MDILTGLNIVKMNLDKITVVGTGSAGRLAGCADMVDKLIAAIEAAQQAPEAQKQEETNG